MFVWELSPWQEEYHILLASYMFEFPIFRKCTDISGWGTRNTFLVINIEQMQVTLGQFLVGLCVRKPKFWVVGAFKKTKQTAVLVVLLYSKAQSQSNTFWGSKVCPEHSFRTAAATGGSCVLPSLWNRELGFWQLLFREVTICAVPFCLLSGGSQWIIWWNWTRTGCCPPLSFTWGNLEFCQRWVTREAWGDESISNCPLFTVRLCSSLLWKKATCLFLLASAWHAASRERWKESSWDSSRPAWACNATFLISVFLF